MPPLVWQMHSFPFQFKKRIRKSLHSHGIDENIHFLRIMLTGRASVVIQLERIGEQNSGLLHWSYRVDWINWINSGSYAGSLAKRHTPQRVGNQPYRDSESCHYSEGVMHLVVQDILGEFLQNKRQIAAFCIYEYNSAVAITSSWPWT